MFLSIRTVVDEKEYALWILFKVLKRDVGDCCPHARVMRYLRQMNIKNLEAKTTNVVRKLRVVWKISRCIRK